MFYYKACQHPWFMWFKRGISLKYLKWFIRYFFDFKPSISIFPKEVQDIYQYFKEKTNFVQGYRLISFVASQGITWIMTWDYSAAKLSDDIDLIYLVRSNRIKWWTKFNITLIKKERIDEWVKIFYQVSLAEKQGDKEALFLAEKNKIMATLPAATSKEKF